MLVICSFVLLCASIASISIFRRNMKQFNSVRNLKQSLRNEEAIDMKRVIINAETHQFVNGDSYLLMSLPKEVILQLSKRAHSGGGFDHIPVKDASGRELLCYVTECNNHSKSYEVRYLL